MSLQEETLRAVNRLELSAVSEEWVEEVWAHNLCESAVLPCEELLDIAGWRGMVSVCEQWRDRTAGEEEKEESGQGTFFLSSNSSNK